MFRGGLEGLTAVAMKINAMSFRYSPTLRRNITTFMFGEEGYVKQETNTGRCQAEFAYSSTLKLKAICSFETMDSLFKLHAVITYKTN
jgi:hypothetical protein